MKKRLLILLLLTTGCSSLRVKNPHPEYVKNIFSADVKFDQTAGHCRSPEKDQTGDWHEALARANSCWQKRDWHGLRAWADQLILTQNRAPWGVYFMSVVESREGRLEKAMWLIDKALQAAPGFPLLSYEKGRILWRQGDKNLAVAQVEKAVDDDRLLIEGHVFLSQVYAQDGLMKKAEEHRLAAEKLKKDGIENTVKRILAQNSRVPADNGVRK